MHKLPAFPPGTAWPSRWGPRRSPAAQAAGSVGSGGARERAKVSPSGGNRAKRTLRRRGPGQPGASGRPPAPAVSRHTVSMPHRGPTHRSAPTGKPSGLVVGGGSLADPLPRGRHIWQPYGTSCRGGLWPSVVQQTEPQDRRGRFFQPAPFLTRRGLHRARKGEFPSVERK